MKTTGLLLGLCLLALAVILPVRAQYGSGTGSYGSVGPGGASVGSITNGFVTQTNWISGQFYTNTTGASILVHGAAQLVVAAVTGRAEMDILVGAATGSATITDSAVVNTGAGSVAGNYYGSLNALVPTNYVFAFTNQSTGAGNSSSVSGNTGQQLSPASIGATGIFSGNFSGSFAGSGTGLTNFNFSSPNTIWVSNTKGNDATARLGNPGLPAATLTNAFFLATNSSLAFNSTNGSIIRLVEGDTQILQSAVNNAAPMTFTCTGALVTVTVPEGAQIILSNSTHTGNFFKMAGASNTLVITGNGFWNGTNSTSAQFLKFAGPYNTNVCIGMNAAFDFDGYGQTGTFPGEYIDHNLCTWFGHFDLLNNTTPLNFRLRNGSYICSTNGTSLGGSGYNPHGWLVSNTSTTGLVENCTFYGDVNGFNWSAGGGSLTWRRSTCLMNWGGLVSSNGFSIASGAAATFDNPPCAWTNMSYSGATVQFLTPFFTNTPTTAGQTVHINADGTLYSQ